MLTFDSQGFAHNYECRVLDEFGPGESVAHTFGAPDESQRPPLLVEVIPTAGAQWCGAFRRVFDGCLEALLGCPDPDSVCVVAGGVAYAVPVGDPTGWRDLHVIPAVTAAGYPSSGLLFIASFNVVSAFDSSMKERWATDLESDGIEFVGVDDGKLKVRAFMPGFDDWVVRTISLGDGAATHRKA
jgi:hypothetical protein